MNGPFLIFLTRLFCKNGRRKLKGAGEEAEGEVEVEEEEEEREEASRRISRTPTGFVSSPCGSSSVWCQKAGFTPQISMPQFRFVSL